MCMTSCLRVCEVEMWVEKRRNDFVHKRIVSFGPSAGILVSWAHVDREELMWERCLSA